MSSNPLYGLWKVGTFVQLTGAAWPAGAPACVFAGCTWWLGRRRLWSGTKAH